MMHAMRNVMRVEAERAASSVAKPRVGIVTSYDPNHYAAKVRIQPEDYETGWLPVTSDWVGNQWGFYAPPSIGDKVEVHFQEGDRESGFIVQRFYSTVTKPLPVQSGEYWVVHQSGSFIKLHNDGSVEINAAGHLRLSAQTIKIHASQTFSFDANGQGQKWDGQGVETWQDNDVSKPHHVHAPPETPA